MNENSQVKRCHSIKCISEFQDKEHGKGMRIHNRRIKDGKPKGWTCTVCGEKKEGA